MVIFGQPVRTSEGGQQSVSTSSTHCIYIYYYSDGGCDIFCAGVFIVSRQCVVGVFFRICVKATIIILIREKNTCVWYINTNNSYRNDIIVSVIIQKRIQIGQQSLSTTAKNVNVYITVSEEYALVITHTMTCYHILVCVIYDNSANNTYTSAESKVRAVCACGCEGDDDIEPASRVFGQKNPICQLRYHSDPPGKLTGHVRQRDISPPSPSLYIIYYISSV